jgi:hypothetical protein
MNNFWRQMDVERFANFEQVLGQPVFCINRVYWRRVRPLFYRPLVTFEEYATELAPPPPVAFWGGFQHVVTSLEQANSYMHFVMFKGPEVYSLNALDYNRRRQVKQAAKHFVIRPITDLNEFKKRAYPVYLSFYERTRYQHGAQRRNQNFFSTWAETLFQMPEVVILGGYHNDDLCGVSLSFLIGHTLDYATFFCNTESLRLGLSDMMLHSVREAAAGCKEVRQIFVGLFKGGKGLDDFYLLRGAEVVSKPAFLGLNSLSQFFLQRFMPRQFAHLMGNMKTDIQTNQQKQCICQGIKGAKSFHLHMKVR